MSGNGSVHETLFVKAFILKERQERALFLLSHSKRRHDFTSELDHFRWLDPQFAIAVPPSNAHTAREWVALLRNKGAKDAVWAISSNPAIDGRELQIEEAIESVWGGDYGTLLSCIPGRLGFFRGEEMKSERLLEHP